MWNQRLNSVIRLGAMCLLYLLSRLWPTEPAEGGMVAWNPSTLTVKRQEDGKLEARRGYKAILSLKFKKKKETDKPN